MLPPSADHVPAEAKDQPITKADRGDLRREGPHDSHTLHKGNRELPGNKLKEQEG